MIAVHINGTYENYQFFSIGNISCLLVRTE